MANRELLTYSGCFESMTEKEIYAEAHKFRNAIERAREAGEFTPKSFNGECMNNFPYDCCDDTADLFTHYLYHEFGIDSIRVDGEYYDSYRRFTCGHSWQDIRGLIVDLTGDQFDKDPSIRIKAPAIYVGPVGEFHKQFNVVREEHSCGIECLGSGCHDRMYGLYNKIMKYME